MNTQITQKTNSFDTINLTIPGDVINRNTSNYFSNLKVNEETEELMLENHGDCQQIKFNRDKKKHLGLGHCIYVPHRNIYDISILCAVLTTLAHMKVSTKIHACDSTIINKYMYVHHL
jgi:putative component of toxin-antitoxin plasmid stabilization module